MKKLVSLLVLPPEITDFERRYLERVNRVALAFFALHVPVFALVAWANDTRPLLALILTSAVLVGPVIARATLRNPRTVSVVYGVAAMFMGGLLVHFGQGPVQIEMHFYFFALIAMSAMFGNPLVIVAAAVTVALHHLIVWLVLPRSVFNYDAAWWVVAVHALFVVLEAIATCFIARSFFDNVIGLERIVTARTAALDARNRDMRLLLDSVQQGFLTIDRRGVIAPERSAAVDEWFGVPGPGATWFDQIATVAPAFASRSRVAWEEVTAGIMPIELTLDQMPRRFVHEGAEWQVEYQPIGGESFGRCLVIVTDVTDEVLRESAERERRETMVVFERVLQDRMAFETFFEEGSNVVHALARGRETELTVVKRMLHTLKGNASVLGLSSIADECHALEDLLQEDGHAPSAAALAPLVDRWTSLSANVDRLLGNRAHVVEIDEAQYESLLSAVKVGEPQPALMKRVRELRYEPTAKRLHQFAEQAQRIARRLEKDLRVVIEDHDVRLDAARWAPFWSVFVHAVRNAVDHGVEAPEARVAAGKSRGGTLTLRTVAERSGVVVEIADDGRGVDWSEVARRAEKAGLPAATQQDLRMALFADGVSTAASVTDVSGRGVGMGALLQGARAMGGAIDIQSTVGKGTTLRMTFPRSPHSQPHLAPVRSA